MRKLRFASDYIRPKRCVKRMLICRHSHWSFFVCSQAYLGGPHIVATHRGISRDGAAMMGFPAFCWMTGGYHYKVEQQQGYHRK